MENEDLAEVCKERELLRKKFQRSNSFLATQEHVPPESILIFYKKKTAIPGKGVFREFLCRP